MVESEGTLRVFIPGVSTVPNICSEHCLGALLNRLLAEYSSGLQLAESFLAVLVVVLVVLVVALSVVVL